MTTSTGSSGISKRVSTLALWIEKKEDKRADS
jgi:hypothetical protein